MRFLALKIVVNCVCLWNITLWSRQFLVLSSFSRISWSSGKKIYRPSKCWYNSVICSYKWIFFWSIIFLKKWQGMGILQILLDKCSHLFICMSVKYTLRSGRKPVSVCQNRDIKTNSPCCYILLKIIGTVFSNNVKKHTLSRSTNLLSRNHPTLCFWSRREDQKFGLNIFIRYLY